MALEIPAGPPSRFKAIVYLPRPSRRGKTSPARGCIDFLDAVQRMHMQGGTFYCAAAAPRSVPS